MDLSRKSGLELGRSADPTEKRRSYSEGGAVGEYSSLESEEIIERGMNQLW